MVRRAILVCLLAAGLALPFLARAEHTRFWRESDYSEFEKGAADGVALRSDGKLIAAPRFTEFSDPNLPYLWELRLDSRGRLFAAGGSDAKVVRFDGPGKASTVFESQELAAQALALDSHDNLYVGTSPDGKIYKVTPEGKQSVFFEPNTKYIWSLVVDADGTLYVGTGDKGEVFVVAPDGKGQVFYKSDERHARSLAFDSNGSLLIGTDPDGLIVRVKTLRKKGNPLPEAGPAFVVYETDKKEVTSLLTDASGNLYASAVGDKVHPSGLNPAAVMFTPESAPGAATAPQMALAAPQPQQPAATMQIAPMQFPFASLTGGSEVYLIAPDGSPQSLWKSHQDLVYALAFSASGKLLLGTGNRGQVIELEGNNVFSVLAKSASSQITGFAAARDGSVFLATANPGKVFTLASGYATGGTFESSTFDAKIFSQWGRLTWWGEDGAASGKVSFYVRSGNTSDSHRNWSPWAGPYSKTQGEVVDCPSARFVQWKAVFSNVSAAESPSISWVSLAYLPKNVAPVIDSIVIQDPGIRVQGFAVPVTVPGGAAPVPLRMPKAQSSTPSALVSPPEFAQHSKTESPPQGFEQKGYQSVLWSAHDDNDDDLAFALYYRGEGEKNWKLLKDKIHQDFYSWDTSTMPDGAYYLKLVASDAPSNPSEETLTTEEASERLVVDNTPPTIENLRAEVGNPQVRVHFTARDPASAIENTEYSFDAGDWETVFPVGRVTGSLAEEYVVVMRNLAPGEHTMAVRVSDRFRNTSSAKVTFTVPPGRSH
jgi:hypothetical protein